MILHIIACSLIGAVLLIGVCCPLSATVIPSVPTGDDQRSIVIEESSRDNRDFHANRGSSVSGENIGKDTIRADFRERIASRSVPILRSRGMTDEEIKSELLRDFALTEEQVDGILVAQ